MTDIEQPTMDRSRKAARVIDDNFEKVAATLDRFRVDILAGADDAPPPPLVNAFAGKLGSASDRLRSTKGDELVDYAKGQIVRHPTLITVAAAAAAAALAQLAVATVRRETRDLATVDKQTELA
jgi:hypothetical protein